VDLAAALDKIIRFRDERDWAQFHTVRNLATAISVEAAELQEALLWKTDGEIDAVLSSDKREVISMELADVLIYSLLLAHSPKEDPVVLIHRKLQINAENYPVHLVKGTAKKYTDLT
jgi:NTP pyrophosphatase (non-canonical NTP hydrolase)